MKLVRLGNINYVYFNYIFYYRKRYKSYIKNFIKEDFVKKDVNNG